MTNDYVTDINVGKIESDDCISREKAKQFLYERLDRLNDDELYDIFSRIIDDMYNELPSVTPTRPTARWERVMDYNKCSNCGKLAKFYLKYKYCPNCGSEMTWLKEMEESGNE